MQGVTLAIGIAGSILVILLRPAYALGVLFGVLVWYPEYLRVAGGDMSAGRIVVVALLLRCLCDEGIRRKFVWSRLDKWITLSSIVYTVMYCLTHQPLLAAVANRCGFIMDTWLAYLAVRMILTDKQAIISFIKIVSLVLAPLAILGIIEAVTHHYYFYHLTRFRTWKQSSFEGGIVGESRWGLMRAMGPFSHFIMFGGCFALCLPLIWSLRHQCGYWGKLTYLLSGMAIFGAVSSMSSGSWSMLIVVFFCLALERYKHWTKKIILCFIVLCILAAIVSRRPLYHVLYSYANIGGGDYWARVRLIDAAIDNFGEWWLAGYGGRDPGWGSLEGGYFWGHFTDANNQFIFAGMECGMLGVLSLCAIFAAVFHGLMRADRQTADIQLKSLYWSIGSALVGLIVLIQGVSLFGQMSALFYIVLGIAGVSIAIVKEPGTENGNFLKNRKTKSTPGNFLIRRSSR